MSRAIVLVLCLAAAGVVAAYTHYSEAPGESTPVFTVHVPNRSSESPSPPAPPPFPHKTDAAPLDRASLARALQRELKRVGCYAGEVNGVWTTSSRMAMKSFTDHVNASLPIDNPDHVLLSLVQGREETVCGVPCPPGQAATENGSCMTSAMLARSPPNMTAADAASTEPIEKTSPAAGSVLPATAAAATALAARAAVPKPESNATAGDTRRRITAPMPDEGPRNARPERSARTDGVVPPERVYRRRARRYSTHTKPPRFVRNLLRTFGIR